MQQGGVTWGKTAFHQYEIQCARRRFTNARRRFTNVQGGVSSARRRDVLSVQKIPRILPINENFEIGDHVHLKDLPSSIVKCHHIHG